MTVGSNEPVPRSEYEQFVRMYEVRHSEMRLQTKELETQLNGQIIQLNGKLDALSLQLAQKGADGWKLLSLSMVNFVLGGGLVGTLVALHIIH